MNKHKWFNCIGYLFLISIALLFGCKKDTVPGPDEHNTHPPINLKAFSITTVDSTTTSATISWTAAVDSSFIDSVRYSVYLDSNIVAARIKTRNYTFSNLTPNKKYD